MRRDVCEMQQHGRVHLQQIDTPQLQGTGSASNKHTLSSQQ